MTETEWLACENPTPMLKFLDRRASGRKLRLLAVACCQRIRAGLAGERIRTAVETGERFADGMASVEELTAAFEAAYAAANDCLNLIGFSKDQAVAAYLCAAIYVDEAAAEDIAAFWDRTGVAVHALDFATDGDLFDSCRYQAILLRDIFGNPFRPAAMDPAWRTETVLALARGVYEDRAFDRMPILADALQDAGCTDENVLSHCRGPGPHARGCWVVDLILGKS